MTKILLLFTVLTPFAAGAETFKCVFTEPFANFVYSTVTQKVSLDNVSKHEKTTLERVHFQIEDLGSYVLMYRGHRVATIRLTGQGSDGMSEKTYPFEVESTLVAGVGEGMGAIGGCSSTLLPAKSGAGL